MSTLTLGMLADGGAAARCLIDAGMSADEAVAKRERFARAAEALIAAGHTPETHVVAAFVPGRIEVFGKHTDYCGGRSLLCTVERGMCFVAVGREGDTVRFLALDPDEQAVLTPDGTSSVIAGHWSNYPASVVRRLARNFPGLPFGADVAMSSDLPKASGLSSSSAMIVGTFLVLARLAGVESTETYRRYLPDREALAGYLGTVENGQSFGPLVGHTGVGTFGGSQDHTAILCSKPGRLSVYSFRPVRFRSDVRMPTGVRFVIADSGVAAEKTGDALAKYNRVSTRVRDLVFAWNEAGGQAGCLNDIIDSSPEALGRLRGLVEGRSPEVAASLLSRLDQFLIESNNLIPKAADAFANADWGGLRSIANESHAGADSGLLNQVPQTNALQREMLSHGAIAASAFGAGFGGSVWGLFDSAGLEQWAASEPASRFASFVTRPGCAAVEIESAASIR
ncbi:MAG: galactokinase [Phycisphaerales bacterium]|nr:galactokinase [Phycisphaerales bacterium]